MEEELLKDFAEYCHTRYLGCSLENGKWFYSYDTEIVCMIEDYLKNKLNLQQSN